MKRVAVLVFSLAMVIFSVSALSAQTETGNTGTQNTQTDSTNQGTTGTDQTGSSTDNTEGTIGGTSQGNTETGADNTGTTGTDNSGTDNTGTSNTGTNIETGTGMSSSGGMSSGITGNTGNAVIQNLSRLNEKPEPEVLNEFKPVAEERANELVSKLGLDQNKADEIKESLMDYFSNYWESRVSLDKESNNVSDVKEHNADLANQRVDLIADIEDELTEAQMNQFESFKVEWWKSLDIALFDVQQNAATSSLARENEEGSDEQQ